LPEVLARRYARGENVTVDGTPLADAVCYCRQENVADTVECCNPNCPIQRFHLSCLGIHAIPTGTAPNAELYQNLSEEALSNIQLALLVKL